MIKYESILEMLILIVGVLISTAYITLGERKVLGSSQSRKGPEKVGILGLLQPMADGLKLAIKENILPIKSYKLLILLAPCISLTICLLVWLCIPLNNSTIMIDSSIGLLLLLAITSINVYSVLLAGWSSNSKYGLIGSVRSISQYISYEIFIGLMVINIILITKSLNLLDIVNNQIYI